MDALDGYPKETRQTQVEQQILGWQSELVGHDLIRRVNAGLPEDLQNEGTRQAVKNSEIAIKQLTSSIDTARELLEEI